MNSSTNVRPLAEILLDEGKGSLDILHLTGRQASITIISDFTVEDDFTHREPKDDCIITVVRTTSLSRSPLWLSSDSTQGKPYKLMIPVYDALNKVSRGSKVVFIICGIDGRITNPSRLPQLMRGYEHLTIQLVFRCAGMELLLSAVKEPSGIWYTHVSLKDIAKEADTSMKVRRSYCSFGRTQMR